ncbi:type II toxin-antitoxin system VapC family toxin [Novosphingobium sp.]|uniref:type II toxin-antitoxin system VapC family toxin n=1 Tax=Novosphingobium sp. TaxID=1874826 RepID=UPI003D0B1321
MISYLIDANCVIFALADSASPVTRRIAASQPGTLAISAITFAEVALGTHSGKPPPPDALDALLAVIPLAPFDEAAARLYATLPSLRGRFDRLLAAHALSLGAIVVTNNVADFTDVAGLVIEDWTA